MRNISQGFCVSIEDKVTLFFSIYIGRIFTALNKNSLCLVCLQSRSGRCYQRFFIAAWWLEKIEVATRSCSIIENNFSFLDLTLLCLCTLSYDVTVFKNQDFDTSASHLIVQVLKQDFWTSTLTQPYFDILKHCLFIVCKEAFCIDWKTC